MNQIKKSEINITDLLCIYLVEKIFLSENQCRIQRKFVQIREKPHQLRKYWSKSRLIQLGKSVKSNDVFVWKINRQPVYSTVNCIYVTVLRVSKSIRSGDKILKIISGIMHETIVKLLFPLSCLVFLSVIVLSNGANSEYKHRTKRKVVFSKSSKFFVST